MKKFHIIKRSYIWVTCAVLLCIASLVLFLLNAKFSEEFTGGVNISILTTADVSTVATDLANYLDDQGYKNTNIHINQTSEDVQIKINANLESDEKVAELSTDVQDFLTAKNLISSPDDIIGQAIIGPSVGSYMKTSAFQALIVGIILMVIYMLFAFAKIRKDIPAQVLGISVLCVLIFNVLISL
jgi:preprotein translocase subunit SecF